MAQQFDEKTRLDILKSAAAVPLPSIDLEPPTDQKGRRQAIVSNIERLNAIARKNIITQAQAVIAKQSAISGATAVGATPIPDPNDMDISRDFHQPVSTATTGNPPTSPAPPDLSDVFASLATPHDRKKGDIYALNPQSPSPSNPQADAANDATSVNPTANDKESTYDPRIDALLYDFDAHTAKTLAYYRAALERAMPRSDSTPTAAADVPASPRNPAAAARPGGDTRGSNRSAPPSRSGSTAGIGTDGKPVPPSRSGSTVGIGADGKPAPPSRSGSTVSIGADGKPAAPTRVGSSGSGVSAAPQIDRARDPRLARR